MLRTLHIRDFVIVEHAEIHFGPGFTVFTGETGAGKSILVDALALALGERGDASMLREGSPRADITAVFDTPKALQAWLEEREIDADAELSLRRVIDAQGRSRAYINGTPATVAQLRELGDSLVDIHGQHAHQSLMRPDAQRELQVNGGNRVPVAVFFSEDGFEAARYGERTLSAYRRLVQGVVPGATLPGQHALADAVADWLRQFERVQWMLRLSPRLRRLHRD